MDWTHVTKSHQLPCRAGSDFHDAEWSDSCTGEVDLSPLTPAHGSAVSTGALAAARETLFLKDYTRPEVLLDGQGLSAWRLGGINFE